MAIPELGSKQLCPNCQAKFYDLNKRPAHCPKCEHDFDPEEVLKSRRGRSRAVPNFEEDAEDQVKDKAENAEEEEDDEATTPEIDVEAAAIPMADEDDDGNDVVEPEGDAGVGIVEGEDDLEGEDDAVPFLEEEGDDEAFDDDLDIPVDGDDDR